MGKGTDKLSEGEACINVRGLLWEKGLTNYQKERDV